MFLLDRAMLEDIFPDNRFAIGAFYSSETGISSVGVELDCGCHACHVCTVGADGVSISFTIVSMREKIARSGLKIGIAEASLWIISHT